MTKKITALLLAFCLLICLSACNKEETSSDISSDVSQTETTDSQTEESSKTDTTDTSTDKSSSNTETPSNSSPTSTETSKPTTSDKDNTTSSKPSNTTSTPTTSKPTTSTPSSTPSTPAHTHSWGNWKSKVDALIGRDGTEQRTCSTCKETEERSTKNKAMYNSFYDDSLKCFLTTNDLGGFSKWVSYFTNAYDERDAETITPSSTAVFAWMSARFVLTDSIKADMKQDPRYDTTTDTFVLPYDNWASSPTLVGYIHNGGNKYTVYYQHFDNLSDNLKVELEYNLLNNKPNKYISIENVTSIPSNIQK